MDMEQRWTLGSVVRPGVLRCKLVVSEKSAGGSGVECSVEEICTYEMAVKQCWRSLWLQRLMYAGSAEGITTPYEPSYCVAL